MCFFCWNAPSRWRMLAKNTHIVALPISVVFSCCINTATPCVSSADMKHTCTAKRSADTWEECALHTTLGPAHSRLYSQKYSKSAWSRANESRLALLHMEEAYVVCLLYVQYDVWRSKVWAQYTTHVCVYSVRAVRFCKIWIIIDWRRASAQNWFASRQKYLLPVSDDDPQIFASKAWHKIQRPSNVENGAEIIFCLANECFWYTNDVLENGTQTFNTFNYLNIIWICTRSIIL